jgi:hypothetical protein
MKQKQFTNNTPENTFCVLHLITYKNQTNGDTKTASEAVNWRGSVRYVLVQMHFRHIPGSHEKNKDLKT